MSRRLRIATFNLENLDDRSREGIDFADRLAVLRPQIERLRADILCLQEVNARRTPHAAERRAEALERLLEGTDYAAHHRVVSRGPGGERPADRHNLAVLSRPPVLAWRQVRHDLVPPPLCRPSGPDGAAADPVPVEWERPLLHVTLDVDGVPLHVLNLHLRAPRAAHLPGHKRGRVWQSVAGWAEGFFHATVKRAGQALEARLVVDQIFENDPGALIAVCGDFNADDHETPVRTIRGDEEDTGNGHLAGRVLVATGRSLSESQRYSVIHHGRRVMLDHVLVSRPLMGRFVAAEIHNETLGDELVSPVLVRGTPETYHAPVVAEFALPDRPPGGTTP